MATILIIEDRLDSRKFLVKLLGYSDHRLLEAGDGSEGARQAERLSTRSENEDHRTCLPKSAAALP